MLIYRNSVRLATDVFYDSNKNEIGRRSADYDVTRIKKDVCEHVKQLIAARCCDNVFIGHLVRNATVIPLAALS